MYVAAGQRFSLGVKGIRGLYAPMSCPANEFVSQCKRSNKSHYARAFIHYPEQDRDI